MSAAGPSQGAKAPSGGQRTTRSAKRGGFVKSPAGPSQGVAAL